MTQRIFLSPPHLSGEEQALMNDAFRSNWIAPLGPHVDAFEQEMAARLGCAGALALSSGTAGIHLALRLLGVGAGDTVFCSTLTFIASVNPVLYLGATPVFLDSEPTSWNLSPVALHRALKEASDKGQLPKAVIVVHLYGQSARMDEIGRICATYGVPIIEDAAESLGATYLERSSGTFGRFGIFSFNGNKIITTSGGGMIVSDDLEALEKARFWATQARDAAPYYQHSEIGYNYRLSNLLAAVGRGQLRVLDQRIRARRDVFSRYAEELADLPGITFMPEIAEGMATRWLSVMVIDEALCGITPEQMIRALAAGDIEARHVWKPMHRQPLFAHCRFYPHDPDAHSSVADQLFARGVCLPSGSNLSGDDQDRVLNHIKNCYFHRTGVNRHLSL